MQLQLHLHSHNCSWRPCCYFALWPVLQNLLRFHNFWATWLLLKLVGLHTGCWGGRGGAEMSWGRHNLPMVWRFSWKLSTKWRRSLHEQLRQTLGRPFLGSRLSLSVLCTVVVATQEHTHVRKLKRGSAEQLPVGQASVALRDGRVLQGLAVGGCMHVSFVKVK